MLASAHQGLSGRHRFRRREALNPFCRALAHWHYDFDINPASAHGLSYSSPLRRSDWQHLLTEAVARAALLIERGRPYNPKSGSAVVTR